MSKARFVQQQLGSMPIPGLQSSLEYDLLPRNLLLFCPTVLRTKGEKMDHTARVRSDLDNVMAPYVGQNLWESKTTTKLNKNIATTDS